MPQFGIGNYHFSYDIGDNAITFKFWDPEDANNTATVTVDRKDFPKGITSPEERLVADLAFHRIAKELNDVRDARLKKEAKAESDARIAAQTKKETDAAEFLASNNDVATEPDFTQKDGTNVFTAGPAGQNASSSNSSSDSSSKK